MTSADTDRNAPVAVVSVVAFGSTGSSDGRVHRQRDAVVARVVDGFLHLHVQLGAADRLRHGVARLAAVGVGTAAGKSLLRIAAVVLDDPGCGFDELEVRVGDRRNGGDEDG